jgi:hypothetical protein
MAHDQFQGHNSFQAVLGFLLLKNLSRNPSIMAMQSRITAIPKMVVHCTEAPMKIAEKMSARAGWVNITSDA